jgi:leader peptidase (prepilin peptidase) / N-methyltransferase
MRPFVLVLAAAFGAAVGSFLNVVWHRVPLGESLLTPGSRCPHCLTPLRPTENVPVASWLLLRGRCRTCRAPISIRYPLVELVTALVFVVAASRL